MNYINVERDGLEDNDLPSDDTSIGEDYESELERERRVISTCCWLLSGVEHDELYPVEGSYCLLYIICMNTNYFCKVWNHLCNIPSYVYNRRQEIIRSCLIQEIKLEKIHFI